MGCQHSSQNQILNDGRTFFRLEQHSFQGGFVSVCKLQLLQLFWRDRSPNCQKVRWEQRSSNVLKAFGQNKSRGFARRQWYGFSVSLFALSLMLKFLNTSLCKTNSAEKPKKSFLGGTKTLVTQLPRCFLTCALVRKRVSLDWHCANNILCILLYLVVFCIALYFSAHTKKGSLGTDTELTRHFVTLFASRLLVGGVHILWWLTLRTCLERF